MNLGMCRLPITKRMVDNERKSNFRGLICPSLGRWKLTADLKHRINDRPLLKYPLNVQQIVNFDENLHLFTHRLRSPPQHSSDGWALAAPLHLS